MMIILIILVIMTKIINLYRKLEYRSYSAHVAKALKNRAVLIKDQ